MEAEVVANGLDRADPSVTDTMKEGNTGDRSTAHLVLIMSYILIHALGHGRSESGGSKR
jgi:hypothetical protein